MKFVLVWIANRHSIVLNKEGLSDQLYRYLVEQTAAWYTIEPLNYN